MFKRTFWSMALKVCLAVCYIFSSLAYAVSTPSVNPPVNFNGKHNQSQPPILNDALRSSNNQANTASFSSSQLGWNGPLTFGVSHDSLYNYSWNAQYTQKFTNNFALSGLYEHASDMYRFGGTVGFILDDDYLLKFSAERLSEVLPFHYDSGDINKRVAQNAYGFRYEYAVNNPFWRNLDLGAFYSKADSKSLDPIFMTINGMNAINYRHIAGGIDTGFDVSSEFYLSKYTAFNAHVYYDKVEYSTKFIGSSKDSCGFGWSAALNQLIGKHFIIGAEASNRKIYDTYTANISWLPPYLSKLGLEISLLAEHLVAKNDLPDSDSIGLKINFNPNVIAADKVFYQLPGSHTVDDISIWTSVPAVHMDQVLAIADQKTVISAPIITSISPAFGTSAGGTIVTINGDNFVGTTGITFGGIPAISFSIHLPTLIYVQAPPNGIGTVDLVVTNLGGSASARFTYTDTAPPAIQTPSIESVTPSSGQVGHEIIATIKGKNFIEGASVKFGTAVATVNNIFPDKIIVTVPSFNGASEKVDVTVTNPDGTLAKLSDGFIYLSNQDKNSQRSNACTAYLIPSAGPNRAGTVVSIHNGSGYTAATTIDVFFPPNLHKSIPGSQGSSINYVSPDGTSINFTLPSGGTGPAYISTLNPDTCKPLTFYYHASGTFIIQSSTGPNGAISPLGAMTVNQGDSVTYLMAPDVGYAIQDVLVDGVSVGAVSSYTFSNINADHTISVTFTITTHTINALAETGGSITPQGAVTVNTGANQSFTITPDNCHTIADVLVDDVSHGAVSSYVFNNVTASHTISATFNIKTFNIDSSAGANGSISPNGTTSVNCGTNQFYTINPNVGYHIANVLVDGVSVGTPSSYTFTNVTSYHTISATFAIDNLTITAAADSGGTISPSGAVSVDYGTSKTFTITPDACHNIANVFVDGSPQGAIASYTFSSVTIDHSILATFSAKTYDITATAGSGGSISPSGTTSVDCGADQTFNIDSSAGYKVADVQVDGTSIGAVTIYTFNDVTAPHTISATFSLDGSIGVTATAGPNGTISDSGFTPYPDGATPTYHMTPNANYHVKDVMVDGVSKGAVTSYTFDPLHTTHSIEVIFEIDNNTIDASSGPNGSITPSGSISVDHGASQTFELSPNIGYHLADVVVDGSSVGTPSSYTFNNVTAHHTISATFAIDTNIITASAGAGGSISPQGQVSVNYNANQIFNFVPSTGYHIENVLVDGSSEGTPTSYTFNNVVTAHEISVTFAIDVLTINASAGAHGSIFPSGSVNVNYGDNQTFAFSPDFGYHVADVVVDGTSVGAPSSYTFDNVIANGHTISVTFAIDTHTITANAGTNGSISNPGVNIVNHGDSLEFTITPALGHHVADVIVDGMPQGPITTYNFTNVVTDHAIDAVFIGDTITIEASASFGGKISPFGTTSLRYNDPSPLFVTALHDADDILMDVTIDGVSIGPVPTYSFGEHVTENHTIHAKFLFHEAAVTTLAVTHGQITPTGTTIYVEDDTPTYIITADPGYVISSILVDGKPVSLSLSQASSSANSGLVGALVNSVVASSESPSNPTSFAYTFDDLEAPHTITATFAPEYVGEKVTPFATFMSNFYHTYIQERDAKTKLLEISPNQGSKLGGEKVVITFNNFKKPPTKVTFDGAEAQIIAMSKNSVTVKTPPHVVGKADVIISNAKESTTLPKKFVYIGGRKAQ